MSSEPKPVYEKPAIIGTDSLETRAVVCTKSTVACSTNSN